MPVDKTSSGPLKKSQVVLAFDYGLRHIGVAVGQRLIQSAQPLSIVNARDGVPDWRVIEQVIREWKPDVLLVGLPLNMDGSDSEMSARASKFARQLNGRFALPVEMIDERLSSFAAKQHRQETPRKGGFLTVDAEAACVFLQDYWRR